MLEEIYQKDDNENYDEDYFDQAQRMQVKRRRHGSTKKQEETQLAIKKFIQDLEKQTQETPFYDELRQYLLNNKLDQVTYTANSQLNDIPIQLIDIRQLEAFMEKNQQLAEGILSHMKSLDSADQENIKKKRGRKPKILQEKSKFGCSNLNTANNANAGNANSACNTSANANTHFSNQYGTQQQAPMQQNPSYDMDENFEFQTPQKVIRTNNEVKVVKNLYSQPQQMLQLPQQQSTLAQSSQNCAYANYKMVDERELPQTSRNTDYSGFYYERKENVPPANGASNNISITNAGSSVNMNTPNCNALNNVATGNASTYQLNLCNSSCSNCGGSTNNGNGGANNGF